MGNQQYPNQLPKQRTKGGTSIANRWIYFTFAGLVLGLDWASKFVIARSMEYGDALQVTKFFNLIHTQNRGAAFGFLSNAGGWQYYLFIVIALIVSTWLIWSLIQRPLRIHAVGYALLLGGAVANMIDRLWRGAVLDYLDFHWAGWHWPAFNIADVAIVIGVSILFWAECRSQHSQ